MSHKVSEEKRCSRSPLKYMATAASLNPFPIFWLFLASMRPAKLKDRSTAADVTGYQRYGVTAINHHS